MLKLKTISQYIVDIASKPKTQEEHIYSLATFDEYMLMMQIDTQKKITKITNLFCKLSGYKQEELLGSSKILTNEVLEKLKIDNIYVGDIENTTKSGKKYWVNIVITPQYNSKNEIESYIAIGHDITIQKDGEFQAKELKSKIDKTTNEMKIIENDAQQFQDYALIFQNSLLQNTNIDDFFKEIVIDQEFTNNFYFFNTLKNENECLLIFINYNKYSTTNAFTTMILKIIEDEILKQLHTNIDLNWIKHFIYKRAEDILKQENLDKLFSCSVIHYNKVTQKLEYSGVNQSFYYTDINKELCIMEDDTTMQTQEGMRFYPLNFNLIEKNALKSLQNTKNETLLKQKAILLKENIQIIGFEIDKKSSFEKILLEYDGMLTQGFISHSIATLEYLIANDAIMKKVVNTIIELIQNMQNYAKSCEIDSNDIQPFGYIKVTQDQDDTYHIVSKNIISLEDKEKIKSKLHYILSLKNINKIYKEVYTDNESNELGFYTIAKLTSSIKYSFSMINEEKYHFKLSCFIKTRKKKAT